MKGIVAGVMGILLFATGAAEAKKKAAAPTAQAKPYQICFAAKEGKLSCKPLSQAKFCLEADQCQPLAEAVVCTENYGGNGQICVKFGGFLAEVSASAPAAAGQPKVGFEPEKQPVSGPPEGSDDDSDRAPSSPSSVEHPEKEAEERE